MAPHAHCLRARRLPTQLTHSSRRPRRENALFLHASHRQTPPNTGTHCRTALHTLRPQPSRRSLPPNLAPHSTHLTCSPPSLAHLSTSRQHLPRSPHRARTRRHRTRRLTLPPSLAHLSTSRQHLPRSPHRARTRRHRTRRLTLPPGLTPLSTSRRHVPHSTHLVRTRHHPPRRLSLTPLGTIRRNTHPRASHLGFLPNLAPLRTTQRYVPHSARPLPTRLLRTCLSDSPPQLIPLRHRADVPRPRHLHTEPRPHARLPR
ncbi:hypothetical protein QD712_09850 [Streptomyces acidiscabies]|uniref:hypothetical protein n=1 Tax=Streptomyces acidiscabies TaxID=42234 RepID=UPI0030CFE4DD